MHELGDSWPEVPTLEEALVAIGPETAAPLFEVLVAGEVPAVEGLPARALDQRRELAVFGTLELLPRARVRRVLERSALETASNAERIQALRVLARLGTASDLRLIGRLGVPRGGGPGVDFELRGAYRDTLERVLRREAGAVDRLADLLPELHPALHRLAVSAIGSLGGPAALGALTRALGRSPALDPVLLVEVRHLAGSLARPPGALLGGRVRPLLGARDSATVALAARTLEAMDARGAVPELIPLLGHAALGVRKAAHDALQALTSQKFARDPGAWSAWYEAQARWFRTRRHEQVQALQQADRQAVAAAVRELAAHRVFHDELANELLPCLESTDPQLVVLACGALAYLGSWDAVDALTESLESPEPDVREAARAALTSITGLDLPGDGAYWRTRIALLEERE